MRIIYFFLLSFFSLSATAQIDWSKYESIKNIHASSVEELSQKICEGFDVEEEKVAAIYYWVANNISYDYKLLKKIEKEERKKSKKKYTKEELKKKEIKEINRTLKSRKGVCEQYSLLFKALCLASGIQSELIGGWVKSDPLKTAGLGGKHAWNAVHVGGNWRLIDVTFASGYLDDDNKFVFAFTPDYFFVDPEAFKLNHHPRVERWQLSSNAITKSGYKSFPYVGVGYFANGVCLISPTQNKLKVSKDIPVEIKFTSKSDLKKIYIQNLRKETLIDAVFTKSGEEYIVIIDSSELKSGVYGFLDENEKILFSYRITVN